MAIQVCHLLQGGTRDFVVQFMTLKARILYLHLAFNNVFAGSNGVPRALRASPAEYLVRNRCDSKLTVNSWHNQSSSNCF